MPIIRATRDSLAKVAAVVRNSAIVGHVRRVAISGINVIVRSGPSSAADLANGRQEIVGRVRRVAITGPAATIGRSVKRRCRCRMSACVFCRIAPPSKA